MHAHTLLLLLLLLPPVFHDANIRLQYLLQTVVSQGGIWGGGEVETLHCPSLFLIIFGLLWV